MNPTGLKIKKNILKWTATIKVGWANYTAYRLNFLLQIIGPSVVFFFIKFNLWQAIYNSAEQNTINDMTLDQMIHYHVWVLLVGLLYRGHSSANMGEDIRLGKIATYMIYPFNFWEYHSAHFLAFQTLQMTMALATYLLLSTLGLVSFPGWAPLFLGLAFALLSSVLWFFLQYAAGLLAFWLDETWMVRVIIELVANFTSGAIIPLTFFPGSWQTFLHYSPFPLLASVPVQILMGKTELFLPMASLISLWVVILFILCQWLWNKGVRQFSGAGM